MAKTTNQVEFSLKEVILLFLDYLAFLKRNWLVLLLVAFLFGGLGYLYSLRKQSSFTAEITYTLKEQGSAVSAGGVLSQLGIGRQAGLNLDKAVALGSSRQIIQKVLLTQVSDTEATSDSILLANAIIDSHKLHEDWENSPKFEQFLLSIRKY